MAGLWTRWRPERRQSGLGEFGRGAAGDGDDDTVETFAILTTAANEAVAEVHDRMPVTLSADEETAWLAAGRERATSLLDPYEGEMDVYAVSDVVNNPANDDPSVVEPVSG
jgi:putative SOS response-associated peptidase YedK